MGQDVWTVAWDDSLILDIPEIDLDHRRFIAIIDALNQAIATRQERSEILRILNLVVADAKSHFEHEERLFSEYAYSDADHHAEVHAGLMRQLLGVLDAFNGNERSYDWIEKALLIKKLVMDHLLEEDMKYRDFLRPRIGNSR